MPEVTGKGKTPKIIKINFVLAFTFLAMHFIIWNSGANATLGWVAVVASFAIAPVVVLHALWTIRTLLPSAKDLSDYLVLTFLILLMVGVVSLTGMLVAILVLVREIRETLTPLIG